MAESSSLLAAILVLLLRELRCDVSVRRRRSVNGADLLDVDMTEAESFSSSRSALPGVIGRWRSCIEDGGEIDMFGELGVKSTVGTAGVGLRPAGGLGAAAGGVGVFERFALLSWTSCPSATSSASTSSASRYHFLRRVQRPQPSWPRLPFCHCAKVSF